MSVTLRPATASDEAFLFNLYASTREGELAMWGWTPAQRESFLRMQWMAQGRDLGQRFPGADHQVVVVRGQPAGRLLVARGGREWRVVDIALLPSHRGGGVGTLLLRELQDAAAKAGVPLRLRVLRDSPARRLYARLGFQPDSSVPSRADDPYVPLEWTPAPRRG